MIELKHVKTNAMRLMDKNRVPYDMLTYEVLETGFTPEYLAQQIGKDVESIFKTIVTVGHSRAYYVFVVQLTEELDLKKAAKAADEKNIELIDQKDLEKVTGYVRGGCSPLGMKKGFPTFFDEKVRDFDKIVVSAGKKGFQVHVSPDDLISLTGGKVLDLKKETKSIF